MAKKAAHPSTESSTSPKAPRTRKARARADAGAVPAPSGPARATRKTATAPAAGAPRTRASRAKAAGPPSGLNVLCVASEALPHAKTGGLADFVSGLPAALVRLGHRVTVVMPRYRGVAVKGRALARLSVPMGESPVPVAFYGADAGGGVRLVLVDCPDLFDREAFYAVDNVDYHDNPFRFALLARAALEWAAKKGEAVDVVHAHDWQTGLAPVYLRTVFQGTPALAAAAAVFTVHNVAYQGLFAPQWLEQVGLGWHLYRVDGLEYWRGISYLKGGIVFADMVTTVSARYAQELVSTEIGCGFQGILASKGGAFVGIANGIDVSAWNPATDRNLPMAYSADQLEARRANKKALLDAFGVPATAEALARPLVAMISRQIDQKGLDLLAQLTEDLPQLGATFLVMGEGEARYHALWQRLAEAYPDRFADKAGFSEELSHLVHGGADLFLMPSRFEPCGLSQLYAQRYGTLPLVRATGGLDDTVTGYDPATGQGTGFKFEDYSPAALLGALRSALVLFEDRDAWTRLQRSAMAHARSWDDAAREYLAVYEQAIARRRV